LISTLRVVSLGENEKWLGKFLIQQNKYSISSKIFLFIPFIAFHFHTEFIPITIHISYEIQKGQLHFIFLHYYNLRKDSSNPV
jgi:hypothetical protein